MVSFATLVFVVTALGGLVLASFVLRGKLAPWPVSVVHAVLGAAGLLLLIFAVVTEGGSQRLLYSIGILLAAALGGFFLVSFHARKSLAPKAVVVIHAGVAAIGVVMLITLLPGLAA